MTPGTGFAFLLDEAADAVPRPLRLSLRYQRSRAAATAPTSATPGDTKEAVRVQVGGWLWQKNQRTSSTGARGVTRQRPHRRRISYGSPCDDCFFLVGDPGASGV